MDVQKTTENDPLENMGTKDEDDETRSWRQENAEIDMLGQLSLFTVKRVMVFKGNVLSKDPDSPADQLH